MGHRARRSAGPGGGRRFAAAVAAAVATGIAGRHLVGQYTVRVLTSDEGVATVDVTGKDGTLTGRTTELYRGFTVIPAALKAAGWTHIGAPDSYDGYVVDDYQGPSTGDSKLFVVTKPSGGTLQHVHTLVPGGKYNDSFVALSPNGQWTVGGEWETTPHLQIYPTPYLNPTTARHGGSLTLAGYLTLDHEVYDIQGYDFTSSTVLICSSTGNPAMFTNTTPLLEVKLGKPLDGKTVTGHVIDLGSIPHQAGCTGTFETEGVDYDTTTGVLRVEENQPGSCILDTKIYEYKMNRR